MRRILTVLAAVVLLWWVVPTPQAFADVCAYCNKRELEEGENPLKCPECMRLAKEIALGMDPDKKRKTGKTLPRHGVFLLDFKIVGKYKQLRKIQIKDDTGNTENYWALLYELHNPSKELTHKFFIDIKAHSDRGKKKVWYHDQFIPDVYTEIRKQLGLRKDAQLLSMRKLSMRPEGERNTLPRLNDKKTGETGKIALPQIQPDETLKCVAIFKNFHPEMDRLVIRVRGLTNWSLLKDGAYVSTPGSNDRSIKEAVLELHYSRPGDEFAHSTDPIRYVKRKWVDDQRKIKSDLPGLDKKD